MPSKQKPISRFLAQELLYDYMNGKLTEQRRQAVEQALNDHPQLQKDLELLKVASEYCDQLAATQVNEQLVTELGQTRSLSNAIFGRLTWSKWPDALKWTTEALVLSAMVVAFTLVTPWDQVKKWIEVQVPQPAEQVLEAEPDIVRAESKVQEEPKKEEPKVVAQAPQPTAKPEPTPTPAKPQGVLYTASSMKVSGLKEKTPEIVEKLLALGAKKAGQVRLGWRKDNGNYFHFTLPKKNQQALLNTLGEYGPVRLKSYPHERVMPEGIIRVILFIKDGPEPALQGPEEPVLEGIPAEEQPDAPEDEQFETQEEA